MKARQVDSPETPTRRRSVALWGTVTAGVLSAIAVRWWIRSPPIPPQSGVQIASSATPPPVRLDETDAWIRHLGDAGTLRLLAPTPSEQAPKEVRRVEGLGRLSGSEYAFAIASLDRVVGKRSKELVEHYDRDSSKWTSEEQRQLEEAELILRCRQYEAYREAFVRGEYFLVRSSEDVPPLPDGVTALNLGVQHEGKGALLVIVVMEQRYGLDAVHAHLKRMRAQWIAKLVYDFNGLPQEERVRLLGRLNQNEPGDKEWRDRYFPPGIGIDRERSLVFALE